VFTSPSSFFVLLGFARFFSTSNHRKHGQGEQRQQGNPIPVCKKKQREQLGKEEDAREMEELPSMFMLNSMKNFLSGCSSLCS